MLNPENYIIIFQFLELQVSLKILNHITIKFALKHNLLHKILTNGTNSSDMELSIMMEAKYLVNHPPHVHLQDKINPSAFIPFCKFGGKFSFLKTTSSSHFTIPTCNAFKPKLFMDQVTGYKLIFYCSFISFKIRFATVLIFLLWRNQIKVMTV